MANLLLVGESALAIFYSIMLGLDGIIYWAVGVLYNVFILVCQTQLFTSATFNDFTTRIYAILGIVMLFILAFQMLNNIVDPERGASGEASVKKLVTNIVVSLLLLVLLPTAFKYLYRVQKVVLEENIIGRIIMVDNNSVEEEGTINLMGKQMIVTIFSGFISTAEYPSNPFIACENGSTSMPDFCARFQLFSDPTNTTDYGNVDILNVRQVRNGIDEDKIIYRWGISSVAGIFVVYMLLSFCIDMGIRVAKLAYFQLIAPIPIVLRIIPKQDKIFDNWVKSLTNTYLDVFIRLIIIYFGIFLIDKVPAALNGVLGTAEKSSVDGIVRVFANMAIIFGILAFMKEAPKLMTEMLGLDSGSMNLGIKNKLANVPIAGRAVLGAANKIHGSVSGAFGRGHSALLNGENVGAAMLRGAVLGGMAGGSQYRKQLDEQYREITGDLTGKGSMIMRGGSIGTKMKERAGKIQNASYEKTMQRKTTAMESKYGIDQLRDSFVDSETASIKQYKNQTSKIASNLMTDEQKSEYQRLWHSNQDGSKTNEIKEFADNIYNEHLATVEKNATDSFNKVLSDLSYESDDEGIQGKVRADAEKVMISIAGDKYENVTKYKKKSTRLDTLNRKRSTAKAQKKARSDLEAVIKGITESTKKKDVAPKPSDDKK